MEADQDMNGKIEWDIGLDVGQWDTDFGIGLGVGSFDCDFDLSTDSDLDRPLVEQRHSYHHACNSNRKPHDHIYDRFDT